MIAPTSIRGHVCTTSPRTQRDRNFFARSLFSRDINPRSLALFMRNEPFTLCHARAHFYIDRMHYKALRNDFRGERSTTNDKSMGCRGRRDKCRLSINYSREIRHLASKCNTHRGNSYLTCHLRHQNSIVLDFSNGKHTCPILSYKKQVMTNIQTNIDETTARKWKLALISKRWRFDTFARHGLLFMSDPLTGPFVK